MISEVHPTRCQPDPDIVYYSVEEEKYIQPDVHLIRKLCTILFEY